MHTRLQLPVSLQQKLHGDHTTEDRSAAEGDGREQQQEAGDSSRRQEARACLIRSSSSNAAALLAADNKPEQDLREEDASSRNKCSIKDNSKRIGRGTEEQSICSSGCSSSSSSSNCSSKCSSSGSKRKITLTPTQAFLLCFYFF